MRRLRVMGLSSMTALGLAACVTPGASGVQTADTGAAEDQAAVELREHHRHHHRGGIMQFIAMSLDTLGPDDAKRPQVERLQSDMYACMVPTGGIERALHLTVADGVAAGAIDSAKVDAAIEQLDAAADAVRGCSVIALDQLHATLSPAERGELIDKVQAHWDVWREVNAEDAATRHHRGGRLAALEKEVGLTPDQMDRMSAALQPAMTHHSGRFDRAQVEANVQAFAAAFEGESFDARTVTLGANRRFSTHGAKRMAIFYETVTPMLTAAQRATLAGNLRQHAAHQPPIASK